MAEQTAGITVKKSEDFSEWYSQVIQKAELVEYTDVSGCIIFRPRAYAIWEHVQAWFDAQIKDMGVKNAYFPLFIPENLLTKEKKHVEGFAPEVAWVTHGGTSELKERIAVRPTSETVMYDAYSKWIQSHRDLPLRLNQWCNVVRWEFKHPTPFIRTREFLWQEGHTAFADKKSAEKEARDILELYGQIYEDLYALPALLGKKSENEKFAGADYSLSAETFLPSGKALQAATSHHLGQNFSKAFDITFLDEKGNNAHVYQNSWGISTRSIGAMIMMHGDDKGLVIPPNVAPVHAVIVPILFDDSKDKVLDACSAVLGSINEEVVELDSREGYSPGWKYNEWEMKGVPVRIEIGPKDVEKGKAVLVRRDTGKKETVAFNEVAVRLPQLLAEIQKNLLDTARKFVKDSTVKTKDWKAFEQAIEDKKLIFTQWCDMPSCEDKVKEKTGAKTLNIPFDQPKVTGKCACCSEKANVWVYFAKSY